MRAEILRKIYPWLIARGVEVTYRFNAYVDIPKIERPRFRSLLIPKKYLR